MIKHFAIVAALTLCANSANSAYAQIAGLDAPAKQAYVVYAAEPQVVPAGKPGTLELHFRVVQGFHVNSHTPKSELLIPTTLTLQPAGGVKAGALQFPAGKPYSFSYDPSEKLDVYAGDFTVKLPVVAAAGEHALDASLRYQACDNAACYPPRNLQVKVLFTAK